MKRRTFLTTTGAAAVAALSSELLGIGESTSAAPTPKLTDYPFQLGVASGDPLSDAVVIWTRVVTDPFAPFGGMPYERVPVEWQVAEDEGFQKVVKRGSVTAKPESGHSVHVDVTGLRPRRDYFYRFRTGNEISTVGRTKTAPDPRDSISSFTFAFASCQSWTAGFYTAHGDLARGDHDVVVFLGDYIYEYGLRPNEVRQSDVPARLTYPTLRETVTLDQYRDQYATFKADPDLQASHASAPWISTIDDHEVADNWAADSPKMTRAAYNEFLIRRANAFRAHWEHMPLRIPRPPTGPDLQIYRRLAFGDLIEFNVLDTRQYRSKVVEQSSPDWHDPSRSLPGAEQEKWLLDGLGRSTRRWNIIAQQNAIAQLDSMSGDGQGFGMDRWDGYPASRDRILAGAHERGVNNLVSIGGDLHRSIASDLKLDFNDPDSPTVGAELGGTSISSGGDGVDLDVAGQRTLDENPHVKYVNVQRGYVRCTVTADQLQADYRVAEYISEPGSPMSNRISLVVDDGRPGLREA